MWQRLRLTQITTIKLWQSEEFDEFHTPYRSDWSQPVFINARFIVACHAISRQRKPSPKAETLGQTLIPASKKQQQGTDSNTPPNKPEQPHSGLFDRLETSQAAAEVNLLATPTEAGRAVRWFLLTGSAK